MKLLKDSEIYPFYHSMPFKVVHIISGVIKIWEPGFYKVAIPEDGTIYYLSGTKRRIAHYRGTTGYEEINNTN